MLSDAVRERMSVAALCGIHLDLSFRTASVSRVGLMRAERQQRTGGGRLYGKTALLQAELHFSTLAELHFSIAASSYALTSTFATLKRPGSL